MNTHDKIELPPLPEWSKMDNLNGLVPSEIRQHLTEYATAAVEADRQARGEPVAYRVLRKNFDGQWVSDDRYWRDGQPGKDLIKDIQTRSDGWKIEIAYTTPQPQQIPEGFKLVPIEPTEEMLKAGDAEFGVRKIPSISGICYKAMLEAVQEVKPAEPDVLPGEAIFGFAAWLTSLKTPVTFSECHGAAIGADLAAAYNKSQGFDEIREDFHERLKPYPEQEPTQPAEPMKVPSMRELIADDAYAATFQSVGQYRKALLTNYSHNTPCCNNPSQCWEPCGELGNSLGHAAVAPKGVNSIPPLCDDPDDLTVAYMSGLEDGKKHNRTDATRYRLLRSMPQGLKILTQVAPGEWEEILSGDDLDTFLKEYPR